MFGTMKKAMVIAAVAAVGAVAPAVASADRWYVGGNVLTSTAQVEGESSLSFTAQVAPGVFATTTCDVYITADIYNQAGTGHGDVTVFDPTEASCQVTGVPNCRVSLVDASTTPWTIEVLASTRVRISNVDFTNTYVNNGGTCPLAGNRQITGSVTGTWSNATNELQFVNEGGLTVVGVGPAVVNGNAYLEEEGTGAAVELGV